MRLFMFACLIIAIAFLNYGRLTPEEVFMQIPAMVLVIDLYVLAVFALAQIYGW
jgi:hypothetical protein